MFLCLHILTYKTKEATTSPVSEMIVPLCYFLYTYNVHVMIK